MSKEQKLFWLKKLRERIEKLRREQEEADLPMFLRRQAQ